MSKCPHYKEDGRKRVAKLTDDMHCQLCKKQLNKAELEVVKGLLYGKWKTMIDDEAEAINEIIIKREKARKKGNEVEVEEIEELLKKAGFEIKDNKDSTVVTRKKGNV